jgi:hypothetical protein
MHASRDAMKKEAKSLLVFATAYALGLVVYFQFASGQKKGTTSWVLFGLTVGLAVYIVPALWRLRTLAKPEKK